MSDRIERARDAIAQGCATPEEYALVMGDAVRFTDPEAQRRARAVRDAATDKYFDARLTDEDRAFLRGGLDALPPAIVEIVP